MRVAVACDGETVSPHFGRCERFLVAEVSGTSIDRLPDLVNPGHEPGLLPRIMREQGIECVLAGGAGPRAVGMLQEAGIQFIAGVSGNATAALADFAAGTLESGDSSCEH